MTQAGEGSAARRTTQLSAPQIVGAALRIIQRGGVESLSMRRLSKELGVSPMAPYYYVADKNGLLDLVVEAVLSEVVVPGPADGSWDVRLRVLIDRIDAELRGHPGLGDVLLEGLLGAQRGLLDAIMELLLEAGFGERDVLMAYATVHTYLYGRHKVTMMTPEPVPGVEQPPSIARTSAYLDSLSGRDYYSFGVETIIEGLRAQLRARSSSTPPELRSPDAPASVRARRTAR